jgi:DNA-binding PadR family transcriptional regulator
MQQVTPYRLSVTEFAVLGILAEGPTHGFAISRQLDPGSEVGRVITVRRPLVYRALDRLVELGFAEPTFTEKGEGPQRVIHRVTPSGRGRLNSWLNQPVEHVRDLRIEFLLKLALLRRSDRSPFALIRAQRTALDPTLAALDDPAHDPSDHVELWRQHNAAAAAAYLEELETGYASA